MNILISLSREYSFEAHADIEMEQYCREMNSEFIRRIEPTQTAGWRTDSAQSEEGKKSESIERLIEVQAFLRSYDSATPFPPPACQQVVSLSQSSCVSTVELTAVGAWAWSRIIRLQESLAFYKSFNTLWLKLKGEGNDVMTLPFTVFHFVNRPFLFTSLSSF